MKRKKGSLLCIFLVYLVILFRITVFRSDFSLAHLMENGVLNLTLFQDYIPIIKEGRWFLFLYLFAGNVVWFVPLGSILILSGKIKQAGKAALWGLVLSLIIETMQYIFGTGVSELDDLALNTLGTWIGAAMVLAYRSYRSRKSLKEG